MTPNPPDPTRSGPAELAAAQPANLAPAAATTGAGRAGAAFRLGVAAAVALAAAVLGYLIHLPPFPTCAFKLWTGLPCPGCGMTRSVVHLAQGDVAGSFRFHPLGLFVAALTLATAAGALHALLRGHDPFWAWFERRGSQVALGFIAALLTLWVVRTFIVPSWAPDPVGPIAIPFIGK